jgi:hypothetical protein
MAKAYESKLNEIAECFDDVFLITTHEKLAPILKVSLRTIGNNLRNPGSMKVATFDRLAEYRHDNIAAITAAKLEARK